VDSPSSPENYKTLIVTREEHIGTIILSRPDNLNALNDQMAIETAGQKACFQSEDSVEATNSFLGKKKTSIQGQIK